MTSATTAASGSVGSRNHDWLFSSIAAYEVIKHGRLGRLLHGGAKAREGIAHGRIVHAQSTMPDMAAAMKKVMADS